MYFYILAPQFIVLCYGPLKFVTFILWSLSNQSFSYARNLSVEPNEITCCGQLLFLIWISDASSTKKTCEKSYYVKMKNENYNSIKKIRKNKKIYFKEI